MIDGETLLAFLKGCPQPPENYILISNRAEQIPHTVWMCYNLVGFYKGGVFLARQPFEGIYQPNQLKRWLAVMPRRFSCRVFSGPADVSQLAALNYAAQSVCPRGIRIAIAHQDAESLVLPLPLFPRFSGFTQYAVILAKEDIPAPHLLTGLAGEALALEMTCLGLAGCFMTGNYRRRIARAHAGEGEEVTAVIPFGVPMDPEGAKGRQRKPLTAFCPDDPALWPLWAYQAAEAIRSAPSAMNRQPWTMNYSGNTFSFSSGKMDSVDTGIALFHLLCAAGSQPHTLRLGSDGKTYLLTAEDARQTASKQPEKEPQST